MPSERRRSPRIRVNLPARWADEFSEHDGEITSLSVTGCFVLTGGIVLKNERVRLEITLPDESQIYPWGEVTDEAYEIGFAVRFTSMHDFEAETLKQFVAETLASSRR